MIGELSRFEFTLENNVGRLPKRPLEPSTIEVSGEVVCTFQDDRLLGKLLYAARVRHERMLLRLVRPHMPKRMFLRLRGRMRADRRAAR